VQYYFIYAKIPTMSIITNLKGKVIVSSQAMPDEPFYDEKAMTAMMQAVINGGAAALRVASERDVRIALSFNVPVIGLTKPDKLPDNWMNTVYITPGIKEVESLIIAGADIIAFDGTMRKRPDNSTLEDIINLIHSNKKLAMADIATFEEAVNAEKLGADIISTTLSGYTLETKTSNTEPDFELLEKLVKNIQKPIFLEGRIWEPSQVKKAFELGAHSVVIGSAITRPHLITKRFVEVL
jgi:N-acylglucosamine-6-phosphate 2-epimerase